MLSMGDQCAGKAKARDCLGLALATFSLWGYATAFAQERNSDTRCFLVSNMFARAAPDAKGEERARNSTCFYLGRLANAPGTFKAKLAAQVRSVNVQNTGPTMQACARFVLAKQAEVNAIGQRLRQPNTR